MMLCLGLSRRLGRRLRGSRGGVLIRICVEFWGSYSQGE